MATCKLLDKMTTLQLGPGGNNARRCLRHFFKATGLPAIGGCLRRSSEVCASTQGGAAQATRAHACCRHGRKRCVGQRAFKDAAMGRLTLRVVVGIIQKGEGGFEAGGAIGELDADNLELLGSARPSAFAC